MSSIWLHAEGNSCEKKGEGGSSQLISSCTHHYADLGGDLIKNFWFGIEGRCGFWGFKRQSKLKLKRKFLEN